MAHRRAPKPNSSANAGTFASTGSVGVPPWIHSRLDASASFACSSVSSMVVAPAIEVPASGRPWPSRSGTEAWVVTSVENGELTTESDPHGPTTLPGAMPVPSVKRQPVIGVQSGCVDCSMAGSTAWPCVYGVSAPRSRRLSWMLLRARLARMAS